MFVIPELGIPGFSSGYYNQILNPICWVFKVIFYLYGVVFPTWKQPLAGTQHKPVTQKKGLQCRPFL